MIGVIYRISMVDTDSIVSRHVLTFDDPPKDFLITPDVAYEYFKVARKTFKIKGKLFVFMLNAKFFFIGKMSNGVFKIYPLGDENEKLSDAVPAKDGNDPE